MAFIFAKPGQAESASTGAAPHNGVWHPLSSIQRSFWFQYRLRPEMQGSSNLAFCIRVSGRLDLDRLSRALNLLAARHPMLRARFREIDGEPEQCIEPMAEVPIEVFDARGLDDPSVQKWVAGDYARPFDLTSAPLMRAKVYRQDDGQHVLLLVFDHLICDGWSFWRLIEELGEILEGSGASFVPDPPVEQSGYFDYVREQREWLSSAKAQKQLAYWSETLRDECPVLNLPEAKSWSLRQFSQRETIPFVLPAELASNVKSLAGGHRCSVYMVLLAAYFALLHRLTGEEHISVGSLMPARGGGRWECVP